MKQKAVSKYSKNRSGWVMLGIVILLYGITFAFDPAMGRAAGAAAFRTVKMIIPILLIVFFLMALLNTFVDPRSIARHLGNESGIKGWIIALAGGVLSHGPGYIWYPMLSDLREHGARDGLIVTFFYARSIKLPWLPLMISYFGLAFTAILIFFILIGAWMQGIIVDRLNRS
jgi:uncharacterized membrane protein YraQ (UPF0718 family)